MRTRNAEVCAVFVAALSCSPPRPVTRMKRKNAATIAAIAAGAVGVALASGVAKRAAKRVLQEWNVRKRLAMRVDEPPFAHLADSQVGDGLSMSKQFSASSQFQSFRVVLDGDRRDAF